MKKLAILGLMLGTMVVLTPSVEAKGTATSMSASTAPQIIVQPRRRWNRNRRTRTVTTTRIRWVGPYRYRETIRTTYFANGRTRTTVIRRVRLSGRRGVVRNY